MFTGVPFFFVYQMSLSTVSEKILSLLWPGCTLFTPLNKKKRRRRGEKKKMMMKCRQQWHPTHSLCVSLHCTLMLTRCLCAVGYPGARHASQTRADTRTWQLWVVKRRPWETSQNWTGWNPLALNIQVMHFGFKMAHLQFCILLIYHTRRSFV